MKAIRWTFARPRAWLVASAMAFLYAVAYLLIGPERGHGPTLIYDSQ